MTQLPSQAFQNPGNAPVSYRLNMSNTDEPMEWVEVPWHATMLSVDLILGSGFSWGTDVATLQYSLFGNRRDDDGNLLESPRSFNPTVTLSTSVLSKVAIPVAGTGYVRLLMTTADGAGDPRAIALLRFR